MPIKLGDLTRQTKTVTVRFEDTEDTLTVSYRPRNLTPAMQAAFERASREGRYTEVLLDGIRGLVAEWDLIGEDGEPVPFTAEALADVPLLVLSAVAEVIGRDVTADPLSSNGSAAISSLAVR